MVSLIVVGRGRLIADVSVADFIRQASDNTVRVRSPQANALHDLLTGPGVTITGIERGAFEVSGLSAEQIGERAARSGLVSDARQRNLMYEVVIRESMRVEDLRAFIHGPTLALVWHGLWLPRRVRSLWESRIPSLSRSA